MRRINYLYKLGSLYTFVQVEEGIRWADLKGKMAGYVYKEVKPDTPDVNCYEIPEWEEI